MVRNTKSDVSLFSYEKKTNFKTILVSVHKSRFQRKNVGFDFWVLAIYEASLCALENKHELFF